MLKKLLAAAAAASFLAACSSAPQTGTATEGAMLLSTPAATFPNIATPAPAVVPQHGWPSGAHGVPASVEAPADYWVRAGRVYRDDQIRVNLVDMAILAERCGQGGAMDGCFVPLADVCEVYVWRQHRRLADVVSHEKKHCAGYSHPKYPYYTAVVRA